MRERSCCLLEDVTIRPEPGDFFLQGCNLGQIGLHLPVLGKRRGRGCGHGRGPTAVSLSRLPGGEECFAPRTDIVHSLSRLA